MNPRQPKFESPIDPNLEAVDFRHLIAFRQAHLEGDYAKAGQNLATTRKSVVRMIRTLEERFRCVLFEKGRNGRLAPSPFAVRLSNELRPLSSSLAKFRDHVEAVHQQGRVLHIGSSPGVFRTPTFRNLFRELQSVTGLRASYASLDPEDAGKALVSGHCDLYFGCWTGSAKRFVTHGVGSVPFRTVVRRKPGQIWRQPAGSASEGFIVSLDGKPPSFAGVTSEGGTKWLPLPEIRWLHWLDHPEDCPPGTLVCAPDMPIDSGCWEPVNDHPVPARQPLHASFLRQHPYEFLHSLAGRIGACPSHS